MTTPITNLADRRLARRLAGMAHNPSARGYHAVYRRSEVNHCPGCGRVQWWVGRLLAECGFCGTAVPLEGARL